MPSKNIEDIRPGDRIYIGTYRTAEIATYTTEQVREVRLTATGAVVITDGGTYGEDEKTLTVVPPPPSLFLSWDEDAATWALLISTSEQEGQGGARLNIALNDAELFDGTSDGDDGVIGGR